MEQWKKIDGYSDYEISSHGRVRSFRYQSNGRVLRTSPDGWGYPRVCLYPDGLGNRKTIMVHLLVLEAFVGPCPEGMEAAHLDNNHENNKVENLAWVTHSDNMKMGSLSR